MALGDEGEAHAFIETARGQGAAHGALAALRYGQHRLGHGGVAGQRHRRHFVQAVDTHNLFHQIGGAIHVAPPAGRGDMQSGVLRHHKTQILQDGDDLVAGHLDAAQCLHQTRIEFDHLVRRGQGARDHHIGSLAAAPFQDQLRRQFQAGQHKLRINTALETIARIGNNGLFAPGAGDADGIEPGGFDKDILGLQRTAGIFAAHDAGNATGETVIGDHDGLGIQHIGLAVQRQHLFMVIGHAGMQAARQLVGIEHMQRTATVLGDQVGGIHQRRNGFHADGLETVLHPFWRGAILDAADQPPGKDGAGVSILGCEIECDLFGAGEFARHRLNLFRLQLAQARGCQIAGNAENRGGIAAIGRNGNFDHRIAGQQALRRQGGGGRRTRLCLGAQFDDAVMIFAQQQFARRTHHAEGFHITDLADLQRLAAGRDHRPGPCQHHLDARPRIGCAADDLQRRAVTGADRAKPQLVGIGMFFGGQNFADNKILQRRAGIANAFDFQPDGGQLVGDLFGGGVSFEMILQPGQSELHFDSPPSRVGMSRAAKP